MKKPSYGGFLPCQIENRSVLTIIQPCTDLDMPVAR